MTTPPKGLAPQSIFAGQFRVIRALAQGGMGTIYQVEQLPTGHPRALKVILPEYAQNPQARVRFEQEARIAAHIESEHVAQVIAAGVDAESNTPWLAMELLQGRDLAACLEQRGRLPAAEVYEILKQLGHALAAAHRIGVIHRDLKPENVFIADARRSDATFTVKVLDFGVAKWIQESRPGHSTAVVGSPLWMAPEQLDARGNLGPHTDLWAFGLLAFTLLTGRPYWRAAAAERFSMPEVVGEIMASPLVAPSQRAQELGVAGALPPGFDAWFARCVQRDGAARHRDVNLALAELAPVLGAGAASRAIPATAAMPAMPTPPHAQPVASTPPQGSFGMAPGATPGTMAWSPGAPPFPSGPSPFQGVQSSGASPFQGVGSSPGFAQPYAPAPSAYQSNPGVSAAPPLYGAAPSFQGQGPAWAQVPPPQRSGTSGALIALLVVLGGGLVLAAVAAIAVVSTRSSCRDGEHRTNGHCCAAGADWDASRVACVCQNPALCGGGVYANNLPQPPLQQSPLQPPPFQQPPALTPLPPPPAQYPSAVPSRPPRPVIVHACDGAWSGVLVENTGSRGSMNLAVTSNSAVCARWTEMWSSGTRCSYLLMGCTFSASGVRGTGRSSTPRCTTPVSAQISCLGGGASFREQVGGVIDTAALTRR